MNSLELGKNNAASIVSAVLLGSNVLGRLRFVYDGLATQRALLCFRLSASFIALPVFLTRTNAARVPRSAWTTCAAPDEARRPAGVSR